MREPTDPNQMPLFPELSRNADIPSITTLPQFDRALGNLIRMSDLGAFIQLNVTGLEKIFTLNIKEQNIPEDFIKENSETTSRTFYLFPSEVRSRLKKFNYEIKSFFTEHNSFRTNFGYFLYRSHFSMWRIYLEDLKEHLEQDLFKDLGHGNYGKYFINAMTEGYEYLQSISDITAPWEFYDRLYLKDIDARRKEMEDSHTTIFSIPPTEISYPFDLLVSKTLHIPLTPQEYIDQVQVSSIFKTIHLEYLVDKKIDSIDDIKKLVSNMDSST